MPAVSRVDARQSQSREAGDYLLGELPGDRSGQPLLLVLRNDGHVSASQGEHWKRWNEALQRPLTRQQKSGPLAGSWDPDGRWDGYGGRVYSTVLPSGKVDRRALPAPNTAGDPVGAEFVAPRTPAEERLSAIWAAVLGLERVGVTANFFELGGHSLKATQVVSRILKEFGAEVALRELFNRPTVAELAREVEARRRTNFEAITHVPDAPHYPLSHAQLRLWVLAQMEGASVAYNMPAALLLDGKVDINSFDRAMEEIAARHEALRTTFVTIGGEPRQLVHAAPLAKLEIASLENETDPVERARAWLLRMPQIRLT